jgi:hypothetical protein
MAWCTKCTPFDRPTANEGNDRLITGPQVELFSQRFFIQHFVFKGAEAVGMSDVLILSGFQMV